MCPGCQTISPTQAQLLHHHVLQPSTCSQHSAIIKALENDDLPSDCIYNVDSVQGMWCDKISSGGARVDNDVQSISNGLVLSSTVPRVDNDANINQLSTKVR